LRIPIGVIQEIGAVLESELLHGLSLRIGAVRHRS
jgi:hypothetical protein